jgi:hypothetical protein
MRHACDPNGLYRDWRLGNPPGVSAPGGNVSTEVEIESQLPGRESIPDQIGRSSENETMSQLSTSGMRIDLNSDLGESFGPWPMGQTTCR